MLVWPMAAKAPSAMEAIEMKMMIWPQAGWMAPKASIMVRVNSAMAATLGAAAKKAVTGVGAPS